jgi:hypothetical protein
LDETLDSVVIPTGSMRGDDDFSDEVAVELNRRIAAMLKP